MDPLDITIDRAAVRLLVSTFGFFLVQLGFADPLILDQYREHIVDIVSAVILIIFAVEFVIIKLIRLWHKLRHDPTYEEKPSMLWSLLQALLNRYVTVSPKKVGSILFKQGTASNEEVNTATTIDPTRPLEATTTVVSE